MFLTSKHLGSLAPVAKTEYMYMYGQMPIPIRNWPKAAAINDLHLNAIIKYTHNQQLPYGHTSD